MTRANDAARRAASPAPATLDAPGAAGTGPPALLAGMPPPVPARARRGRLSSKFGTVNYSVDEMRRLNAKVRAVLPVSAEEWLHVAYQFNYLRPDSIPYREVESLKRKFKKMYCARAAAAGNGTDAALPDYLAEAKALRQLINQRSDKAQSEDAQSELGATGEDPALDHSHNGGAGDGQTGADEDEDAGTSTGGPVASDGAISNEERPTGLLADALRDDGAGGDSLSMGREELRHLRSGSAGPPPPPPPPPPHQQPPHALELPVDGLADGSGSLASRLRAMEEDYHRPGMAAVSTIKQALRGGDGGASDSSDMTGASHHPPAVAATPMATSSSGVQSPPAVVGSAALVAPAAALSTTGIISMLKHSIERKRRTVEEQVLHESARVRKERKKRKMELALYSIHQEQRERESSVATQPAGDVAAAALGSEARLPSSSSRSSSAAASAGLGQPLSQPSNSSIPASVSMADASSLGLMEIMLQYMTAQQLETARRRELEEERRRREELARAERRRAKDQLRRRQHQELMVALDALLGDKFPPSLRHLVRGGQGESERARAREREESEAVSTTSAMDGSAGARDGGDQGGDAAGAVMDSSSVLL